MGDLHICGFRIPVAREGLEDSPQKHGGGGFGVTGVPLGAALFETEGLSVTTPRIKRTTAEAIKSLCRHGNGHVWYAETGAGAASEYSAAGLKTVGSVTATTDQAKFGSRSFPTTTAGGNVTIAAIGTLYTVAAWVKPGGGAWQHEIISSDGTKWIDGVESAGGTYHIDVNSSNFRILAPGSGTDYFDDVVWLPFEIDADWAADWAARTRKFPPLPFLEVSGDALGGFRIDRAEIGCRMSHLGRARFGTAQASARVQLDISGEARTEDV